MKNSVWVLFLLVFYLTVFTSCENTSSTKSNHSDNSLSDNRSNKGQAFIEDEDSKENILQIAISSEDHTTLVAAVQAAQVENALVNVGPLTVFAPVNSAFEALPEGTLENLLKPENKNQLADILKYHVTPGKLDVNMIKKFKKLGQANNKYVIITDENGILSIGGAKIITTIPAGNGIIHVVDKVLLPPTGEE